MQYRIIAIVFVLMFTVTSCVDYEFQSTPKTSDVVIDGIDDDWESKLNFFADEQVAIGVQHDEENFYLCIITNDRQKARQFLMPGVNIWFDTGEDLNYAVRFPIPDPDKSKNKMMHDPEKQSNRNQVFRDLISDKQMFMVVNEDNYPLGTYPVNGNSGIKLSVGMTKDKFVFELQYALKPYNDKIVNILDLSETDEMTITFESIDFKDSSEREKPMGGGMGSEMGNRPPGGGEKRSGGMRNKPPDNMTSVEEIDFSVKVTF